MAQIITILSGKGGTGKTLFAVNLGAYLALKGKKILILDANFSARGVDIALELETKVIYDLIDVVKGDCRIKQAVVKCKKYEGLYIIEPPIIKKKGGVSFLEMSVLIERLKPDYDYIVIDTAGGLSPVSEGLGTIADKVLLITSQEPVSVRTSQSILALLKEREVKNISVIINKVKLELSDEGYFTDVEYVAEELGAEVCGVIPDDESMNVAFNNGQIIIDIEESVAAEHLNRVIQRFLLTE